MTPKKTSTGKFGLAPVAFMRPMYHRRCEERASPVAYCGFAVRRPGKLASALDSG
jgi:hypothetical protein